MQFLEIWERVTKRTDIKKLSDIAVLVGVSGAAVSKRKKEGTFPVEWAFKIGQEYNLSTDWIMDGKVRKNNDLFKEIEEWVNETGGNNIEWFEKMFKESFPHFEKWKQRKEDSKSDSPEFPNSKAV